MREDSSSKLINEVPAMSTELNNLNNGNRDLKVCARKYKLRNWKASMSPENSTLQPPVTVASPVNKNEGISLGSNHSGQILSPEPTKKYFFPYRQKRLEQWIDPKENSRPFKIRNWQSNTSLNESSAMPISNTSDQSPVKNLADSSVPEECPVIPESELMKRYTFPFRQKHLVDSEDNELGDSPGNLPPTPYWRTVGYSLAVKQEARRRRRSVSSSLLTTTRRLDRGHESEKSKEFSQSVEISCTPISESSGDPSSSSPSGSATTFAKMKLGFVNCFSKIKRVNSKNNLNKGFGNNKNKRSFKSMFQSRENIHLESMEKECRSKSKEDESSCDFYPSYIPFQKERFETDVRKRMSELPKN